MSKQCKSAVRKINQLGLALFAKQMNRVTGGGSGPQSSAYIVYYTVGIAGPAVTWLSKDSGGLTPSYTTYIRSSIMVCTRPPKPRMDVVRFHRFVQKYFVDLKKKIRLLYREYLSLQS